ncbi:MAG TPA: ATPase domain-containing protein [Gemmatimonadaceae bacterium]|nr:ATPase domain-containing protein [Gemmatimonadaceae bacterium]
MIRSLRTGVPGFDAVLGGGLPEFSFNLIAGEPGSGKTTLAQQIVFANATVEQPALYFTVLGEPTLKMLRYQRLFSFFDLALVGSAVQYVNLSAEAQGGDLSLVLQRIVDEVERVKPGIIVIDSFRTVDARSPDGAGSTEQTLEHFVQRLALHLTSWEVTSFLIGDYPEHQQRNPIFTVADGVFWMFQATDRNSVVRKMQVLKVRGRAPMPGLHTFRVTDDGVQIFPRIPERTEPRPTESGKRLATGVPGLDEVMGGGIPAGDAVMLAGPTGSGKTTFARQFIAEGLRRGEGCVVAVFEEYPEEYLARARARNAGFDPHIESGRLELIYLRPLDLSVDEALYGIREAVDKIGATRVAIDSLSGFEIALAPTFREDFRESLYRLVGALTATGVTVFMTAEVVEGFPAVHVLSEKVSFITDDILLQRFVEIEGELHRVISVVKMRGSDHSKAFLTYDVTETGARMGPPLMDYHGILTGIPTVVPHRPKGRTRR